MAKPHSAVMAPSNSTTIGLRVLATLSQQKPQGSPELGRSPFWERPSRALPDPEEMPASSGSRPPLSPAVNKGPRRVTYRVGLC